MYFQIWNKPRLATPNIPQVTTFLKKPFFDDPRIWYDVAQHPYDSTNKDKFIFVHWPTWEFGTYKAWIILFRGFA